MARKNRGACDAWAARSCRFEISSPHDGIAQMAFDECELATEIPLDGGTQPLRSVAVPHGIRR
jgi:hypothetical protein